MILPVTYAAIPSLLSLPSGALGTPFAPRASDGNKDLDPDASEASVILSPELCL